ncbi:hypothetical protein D3C76_312240 [compost metagenome]
MNQKMNLFLSGKGWIDNPQSHINLFAKSCQNNKDQVVNISYNKLRWASATSLLVISPPTEPFSREVK